MNEDTDNWLLIPEHDRKGKRIRIGYLNLRGNKKHVFVVLIAGEISFMAGVQESFLNWKKGSHVRLERRARALDGAQRGSESLARVAADKPWGEAD